MTEDADVRDAEILMRTPDEAREQMRQALIALEELELADAPTKEQGEAAMAKALEALEALLKVPA